MYARLLTFRGAGDMAAGLTYVRGEAVPLLHSQRGYSGLLVAGDHATNIFGVLSLWSTEDDRNASDSALSKVRKEGGQMFTASITMEKFEELSALIEKHPVPGDILSVTRVHMDLGSIQGNRSFFENEVGPKIAAQPGFCTYRVMGDRNTGQRLLGVAWKSREAAQAAAVSLQNARSLIASRGIEIEDALFLDIFFSEIM